MDGEEKEVYVHQSALAMANAGPGDTVLFFLHWSAKGLPQAAAPIIRIAAETFALKGEFKKPPNSEQGYIENTILKTIFKKDTVVNGDWAELLDPGDILAFNASIRADGTPMFEMGQPCQPDWEPTPGDLNSTKTSPDVQALQVVKGTHGMQAQSPDLGPDGKPLGIGRGVYGGIMRVINTELRVCTIESAPLKEQFGCDITCGVDLIMNEGKFTVQEGDVVRFELSPHLLPGAKPQAMSVTRMNAMAYTKPKQKPYDDRRRDRDSRRNEDEPFAKRRFEDGPRR